MEYEKIALNFQDKSSGPTEAQWQMKIHLPNFRIKNKKSPLR